MLLSLFLLSLVDVGLAIKSHHHHHDHQHLHKARGAQHLQQNATAHGNASSVGYDTASAMILRAHSAMAIANKLRLDNVQYNSFSFTNSSTRQKATTLAPPLDYNNTNVLNGTLIRRDNINATHHGNTTSFSYTIPPELAEAARIVAQASPPAPSSSDHAEVATAIRAKYQRKVNDTNAMPQVRFLYDSSQWLMLK
jgi:hypothetical protein